jgi:hypothetical protein
MSTKEIFEWPRQRAATGIEVVVELGVKDHVRLISMSVSMMLGGAGGGNTVSS